MYMYIYMCIHTHNIYIYTHIYICIYCGQQLRHSLLDSTWCYNGTSTQVKVKDPTAPILNQPCSFHNRPLPVKTAHEVDPCSLLTSVRWLSWTTISEIILPFTRGARLAASGPSPLWEDWLLHINLWTFSVHSDSISRTASLRKHQASWPRTKKRWIGRYMCMRVHVYIICLSVSLPIYPPLSLSLTLYLCV